MSPRTAALPRLCADPACDRLAARRDLCRVHYQAHLRDEHDLDDGTTTEVVRVEVPRRIFDPVPWKRRGACRNADPLIFFAQPDENLHVWQMRADDAAREYCDGCSVSDECRHYARAHREFGLWGGETEGERAAKGYPPPVITETTSYLVRLVSDP